MSKYTITTEIIIKRPIADVWEIVTSNNYLFKGRNRWVKQIVKLDDSEEAITAGSTYKVSTRFMGFKDEITNEIITLSAPNQIAWKSVPSQGPLQGEGHFDFQEGDLPNTTRLIFTSKVESANIIGLLLQPVLKLSVKKFTRKTVQQLKKISEES